MLLILLTSCVVLLTAGVQAVADKVVYENPCDRSFPTAASLEISDGEEGCTAACSLQAYKYAILYMGSHCFCDDTFDVGTSAVVPANFSDSPTLPCNSSSNSYASVYSLDQAPGINISGTALTSDPLLVTLSYSLASNEPDYLVELHSSDSRTVANLAAQQIYLNQTTDAPISLNTLGRVELDVFVYKNGSLDRPNSFSSADRSFPADCLLSGHCTRDSVVIEERTLDVQSIRVECPSTVLTNDRIECIITVIGQNFDISLNFGDNQMGVSEREVTSALGSSELVLGVMESAKYHDLSLATYGSTQLQTSYLIFHRTFQEPGIIHAIEYTVAAGGSFYFMVYTPTCPDEEIYCHKLRLCVATQIDCDTGNAANIECAGAKVYSLSKRVCVENGAPSISVQTPGPFSYSLTASVLVTDSLGSKGTIGKSLIHKLDSSQYMQVSAGSIMGVLSTSGALTTVSFAGPVRQPTRVLASSSTPAATTAQLLADYADSDDEPVVSAHVWKASIYTVDHIFQDGCITYNVQAEATTSTSTITASHSVQVVDVISGVTIEGPPIYGNSSDGHLVVKTNTANLFSIPEHISYCDTDYLFDWGDSTTQNVSGTSASHTYSTAGIYNIVVMGYTPLGQSNASRTILAQDEIIGLTLNGVATVTEFGTLTTFTVQFSAGTNVTLTFNTGDGHIYAEAVSGYTASLSHNYSAPGLYLIDVTLSNDVSLMSETAEMPVEVPISGLSVSYGDIFYHQTETTDINIQLATGTRVNFTCTIDGSRTCSNWWTSWENHTGIIKLGIADYLTTGDHFFTISAVNLITPIPESLTEHISVLYPLDVANVTTFNTSVVAPGDVIDIFVNINTGSRLHINLSCDNGHTVDEAYRYKHDAESYTEVLSFSFSNDGVYICLVTVTSPIENHMESLTFKVQYPITGVTLERINTLQEIDSSDTILRPPDYFRLLQFAILRPVLSDAPTNCSWTVQFGDEEPINSTEYLSVVDESAYNVLDHQHMISFHRNYTQGGSFEVRVVLWNEITPNWSMSYKHVIHEEIIGTSILSILHVSNGVTRKGYPSLYRPEVSESYTENVYEFDSDLQFTGDVERGTNVTWTWNFGDSSLETGCNCSVVTHNYTHRAPGLYNITLTISNNINSQSVSSEIKLQRRVENVMLTAVATTVVRRDVSSWVLDFGLLGTDACYYLDLGTNDAMAFGNTDLCKNRAFHNPQVSVGTPHIDSDLTPLDQNGAVIEDIMYTFQDIGRYDVTFWGVNLVSSDSSTKVIGVTSTPCAFPVVEMHENNCIDDEMCIDNVKAVYKSKDIMVKAKVGLVCEGRKANHTWTVYKIEGTEKSKIDVSRTDDKLTSLLIANRLLDYGLYEFEITVEMMNESGIVTKNSTLLHVVATPLVAALVTGPLRVVKYDGPFILDAQTNSYDPDLGDGPSGDQNLTFIWLCRRDCEDYALFTDNHTKMASSMNGVRRCDHYNNAPGVEDMGCFHNDSINYAGRFRDDTTEGRIEVPTKGQSYENSVLHFDVYVQKGDRSAHVYLRVKIASDLPPEILISCGVNCKEKTNLDQRWAFSTSLVQRDWSATYSYQWNLYNSTADPNSWEAALNHPIDANLWERLLANTGRSSPSLAFVPDPLGIDSSIRSIFVAVEVWKEDLRNNTGKQIIPVTFNNPPIVNESLCAISPSNGTAKNTTFQLECSESTFVDEDQPLMYELHVQTSLEFPSFLFLGPVTDLSELTGFQLPFGTQRSQFIVNIQIKATDKFSSSSTLDLSVKVVPMNKPTAELFADSQDILDNDITQLLASGDTGSAVAELSLIGSFINNYDQTKEEIRCALHVCPTETSSPENGDGPASPISAKEIRNKAIDLVFDQFDQNTVEDALRCANVLQAFTQVTSELSKESLDKAEKKLDESMNLILASKDLGYADTIISLKSIAAVLGNTLEANKINTRNERYDTQGRAKRDATEHVEGSGAEASLQLLNSIGKVLGDKTVLGDTPETLTTSKLQLSSTKRTAKEIDVLKTSNGANVELSNDVIASASNETEESLMSIMLCSMANPFYSNSTENMTESETLRLLIRDKDNNIVGPGNDPKQPHLLFLPTPAAETPAPLMDIAGFGDISTQVKLTVGRGMSLSLFLGLFVGPSGVNLTGDISNYTHSNMTGLGNSTIDIDSIGLTVYLKKRRRVATDDYDYKCELPSQEAKHSAFSTYLQNTSNGLPSGINGSQLHPFTCFISDKELALDVTTDIYLAMEYTHADLSQNSTRRRRNADTLLDPNTQVYYSMTPITSQCKFFDPNINDWNTDGCEVGPLTTVQSTQCVCTTLSVQENEDVSTEPALGEIGQTTDAYYQTKAKYNPFGGISFGASFAPPFNTFDPHDPELWKNLSENPLIFSVMVSLWCFYLCCLIWARRWDLKDEVKAGASPLLDNDPSDSYLYELTVFTGSKRDAGTTAKVSMIFAGFEEETPPRLIYDDKRPVLQTGGVDSFLMTVPRPLGPLNHIRVWHDNSGRSPGWQFAYMCVVDLFTKDKFFFVSNGWLSVSEGDGVIDRIIPTATRDDLVDFSHLFWTKARKDITDSHIWFSVFGRPAKSVFTRVQRITCCLTLLFTSMNVGILLYQDNTTSSATGQSFSVGPISLTFEEIKIGFYSSIGVFPINLLIVYIFRNSKHRESPRLREAKKKASEYHKLDEQTKPGGKKKKKPFLLPWWFQGVAYFLCLACVVVCFWATVSQGLTFGPEKSERWLKSFVVSFVESLLLSQPIKVVLFAMFYALVIRSPTIEDELDNDPGLLQGEEYLHTHNMAYDAQYLQLQKSLAKYKVLPTPPQPEFIMAAKKKKQKEEQMQALLREILAYIIFVYLLYSISFGSKHPLTWRMYRNQQNAFEYGLNHQYGPMKDGPGYEFEKPVPMSLVGSMDSFWDWSTQTFLPALYSNFGYAGEQMPKFSTMDGVNYIVGSARFRQIRVKRVRCAAAVYKYEQHCAQAISAKTIDRGNYSTHWSQMAGDEEPAEGFTYSSASSLQGAGTNGVFGYYEGGGYAHNLGRTQKSAAKHIAYLKANDWVDKHTRAIFVEFTTFNMQLMLYSVSYIVFEMAPTGAFHPTFGVKLVQPERYQSSNAVMMLISELGIIAYTIYFLVTEIKLFRKLKWDYFRDFWNCVESITLVLLLSSIGMTFFRFSMLVEISKRKQAFKKNDYISYHETAAFEESYLFLLGFIIFLSTGKFLKLLRFNKKMNVLGYTLLYIAKPFLSFMTTMVMVFIAYSHMSYLVFNTVLAEFHTFVRSLFTLFTLMLNKFDYQSMEQANPIFAPIIFSTFTVSMGFMLVSFMLSLIIEGFTTVRADLENQPNKYELVDFVVGKFKAVLGVGTDDMPAMRDKKEDFVEDSQKELDVKFGEFSERVFGMFLQDPDDMKTMKMADDLISREKRQKQKKKKIVFG